MTLHFTNPDAAQAAANKRWAHHRFQKRMVCLTCSSCGKSYQTLPKNVNPKHNNHYCSACRKTPKAYPTAFKSETSRGEHNVKAKLSENDVIIIRRLNSQGTDYTWLADRFNVTRDTIYSICTRRSWKHVPGGYARSHLQRSNKRSC